MNSRPSEPVSAVLPGEPGKEQSEFGRWLMSDVRPRSSVAPDSLPPSARVEPSGLVAPGSQPPPGEPRSTSSVAPDSLTPQLVSLSEDAQTAPKADLEEDDLSVLPGRRKARAPLGRGSLVALGLVLFGASFFLMRTTVPAADPGDAPAAADPVGMTGVLPPPPPEQVPFEAEPSADEEVAEAQQPIGAARRAPAEDDAEVMDPLDPADPRQRLGGPSKARFPDLPLPTLSRLARDELEQARQRDAAARDAKQKRP